MMPLPVPIPPPATALLTCFSPPSTLTVPPYSPLLPQVYSFLAPSRAVVGSVVREKELRLREGMRLMGECAFLFCHQSMAIDHSYP